MRPIRFSLVTAAALALSALATTASAAPQILGLVATSAPLPLTCSDGTCSVEVSAVCLQEHRPVPASGTAYTLPNEADVTLTLTKPDGTKTKVLVGHLVSLTSLRTFTSVSISLPEDVMRGLGQNVQQASLTIGAMVSALPVPVPGDVSPLSQQEIKDYTGHLRGVAEGAMGRNHANLAATRALNQMINVLPTDESYSRAQVPGLRTSEILNNAVSEASGAAPLLNRALDTCSEKLRVERTPSLRACLANQHDNLNSNTTQAVWKSLRPGG